jgi:hypothetical protein
MEIGVDCIEISRFDGEFLANKKIIFKKGN